MRWAWLASGAFFLLLLGGCGRPSPSPPPPPPLEAPNIQATVEARVREQLTAIAQLTPTPPATPDPRRQVVVEFLDAYQALTRQWSAYRQDYNAWRQDPSLAPCREDAARQQLTAFAIRFSQEVSSRVHRLAPPPQAQEAARLLSEAAAREDLALRRLSETWDPSAPDRFLPYESERVEVDKLRQEAVQALESARHPEPTPTPTPPPETPTPEEKAPPAEGATPTPTPPPSPTPASDSTPTPTPTPEVDQALEEFAQEVEAVQELWDSFRADYDRWRGTAGGCDRTAVLMALGEFEARVLALQRQAEALPRASVVRSIAELLTEAAVREAAAVRDLRGSWRPFDPAPFRQYEAVQQEADRLRRQAASALEDLRLQYGLR